MVDLEERINLALQWLVPTKCQNSLQLFKSDSVSVNQQWIDVEQTNVRCLSSHSKGSV